MIKAMIFDLDNCLAPAMEIGTEPYGPALEAIEEANLGTLSSNALEEAINDIWSQPFDMVANKHGFSTAMIEAVSANSARSRHQGRSTAMVIFQLSILSISPCF